MSEKIKFKIDGKDFLADPQESIWEVAKKNEIDIAADQILIEALVIEIDSEKLNEFDLGLDNNNNQNSDGSQYVLSTPSVDSSTDSYKKFLLQFSRKYFMFFNL